MNRKIVLKQRPNGFLSEENFALVQQEIPALHDGEVLIQSKFLSVDPLYERADDTDEVLYCPI